MAIYIPFVEMRRLQKKGYLVRPVLLGALQSWGWSSDWVHSLSGSHPRAVLGSVKVCANLLSELVLGW